MHQSLHQSGEKLQVSNQQIIICGLKGEEFNVTKTIWNNDVPIADTVPILNKYIIAGTIIKPPPTPINDARNPVIIPTEIGSIIEI